MSSKNLVRKEGNEMKKLLKSAVLASALFTAGTATAGTLTVDGDASLATTTDQDAIVIASEAIGALQGQPYDLDPAVASFQQSLGRAIIYEPGITLNEGDKIKFQLTNATFGDPNYYFIVCENMNGADLNGDTDQLDCFELGNIVAGGSGFDYATVRIAKPTGVTIGPNTKYILAAGNSSVGQSTYQTSDNPTIIFNPSISPTQTVSISVPYAEDVGGTRLQLAETPSPTDIISFEQQFNISFGRGDSTIDVTAPSYRTKFVDEDPVNDILNSSDDTDLTASAGTITVDNDSDSTVDDFIPDGEISHLAVTIGNNSTDYTAFDFSNDRVFIDWDGNDQTDIVGDEILFDATTKTANIPGGVLPSHGTVMTDDVYVGVTGNDVLNPQIIPIDATLSFTDPDYTSVNASDNQFITWNINGSQFKIPYLYNNSSTWVRISNDGPVAGDISVDLFDESGNRITNLQLGTVNPNSSVVLYASDIVNAAISAGWTATNVGRFTAIFTVTAPGSNISAVAVQRIPGGVDRVIPVLDRETTWDQ